jgi:ribosomal protein S27AE
MSEDDVERAWELCNRAGGNDKTARCEMVQTIYKVKVDVILRNKGSTILKCIRCGDLFSASHMALLPCSQQQTCDVLDTISFRPERK